jgi:prevent-host-death family protein
MKYSIGAFEAKTKFSEIVSDVEKGNDYIITRRGKPVAKIVPLTEEREASRLEALEQFREFRKQYRGKPGDFNIRKAIEEGRP